MPEPDARVILGTAAYEADMLVNTPVQRLFDIYIPSILVRLNQDRNDISIGKYFSSETFQ